MGAEHFWVPKIGRYRTENTISQWWVVRSFRTFRTPNQHPSGPVYDAYSLDRAYRSRFPCGTDEKQGVFSRGGRLGTSRKVGLFRVGIGLGASPSSRTCVHRAPNNLAHIMNNAWGSPTILWPDRSGETRRCPVGVSTYERLGHLAHSEAKVVRALLTAPSLTSAPSTCLSIGWSIDGA